MIHTSLFIAILFFELQRGHSLKKRPSLVGPRLPRPTLQHRNSLNILHFIESLTKPFELNHLYLLPKPGFDIANVDILASFCFWITYPIDDL